MSLEPTGNPALDAAIWAGDVDLVDELAPCRCCCFDHTHAGCPARKVGTCRGQGNTDGEDYDGWKTYYMLHHGFTEAQFDYGDAL